MFLSNAVIYKITDYNILVSAAKVFLAWDIGATGTLGVRPVISLKSGVLCNGGNGSVDSPYVIE